MNEVKCSMIHKELSTVINGIQPSGKVKLIHEHYLVPAAANQNDGKEIAICCVTCGN